MLIIIGTNYRFARLYADSKQLSKKQYTLICTMSDTDKLKGFSKEGNRAVILYTRNYQLRKTEVDFLNIAETTLKALEIEYEFHKI